MRVRDVMTTHVVCVRDDASFAEVVAQLLEQGVHAVPVVGAGGEVRGMLSEADLISRAAFGERRRRPVELVADYLRGHDPQWLRKSAGLTAAQLMTTPVTTAGPDEELAVVARRMLDAGRSRVPVVEDGRLVGIVTRHDVLRSFRVAAATLGGD